MSIVHYTNCPVCNSAEINPLLTVKDNSVSKEEFVIWQCALCTLRFTQDVPDETSIASYYASPDYISHSNTNKGLLNKLYQKVRNITLKQKAELIISHTKKQGKILDIGAGIGAFLSTMNEKGWEIKGIEPDAGARQKAMDLYQINLDSPETLTTLPAKNFDAITLWHVLEHVHQLHHYIEQLKNLVSDEGRVFIAVPNYTSLDASTYKTYWAAYDVPRHLYHFTPKAMDALIKQHGLQIIAKKPMWFDSFYISLLSSKYQNGEGSWIDAGLTGLRSNVSALLNKNKCSSLIYILKKA
jgi:2-polyprenyl-3-methyl-5-hydroxy-6-metoxy-1,4-benzoquinol methylase